MKKGNGHSMQDTMLIEEKENNPKVFCEMKFSLEMAGFITLKAPVSFNEMRKDECKKVVITNKAECPKENEYVYLISENNVLEFVRGILEEENKEQNDKACCNADICEALYTIKYLYISRKTKYTAVKLLKKGILRLIDTCRKLKTTLEKSSSLTWRTYYAYLYLADSVNEGMYKLRAFQYYSYEELAPYIKKIIELTGGQKDSIKLLQAQLIRNDNLRFVCAKEYYERLLDSEELGVRYWASYALGEIEQEYAEKKWAQERRRGEGLESVYYDNAMDYYDICDEIKCDEIRIIYKLALQNEREGHVDKTCLKSAEEGYSKIINSICGKKEKITSLEFEYLYKSYIRRGWVCKRLKEYDAAIESYKKAALCWKKLDLERILQQIYCNKEDVEDAANMLKDKYRSRDEVIETNIDAITFLQKRGNYVAWGTNR